MNETGELNENPLMWLAKEIGAYGVAKGLAATMAVATSIFRRKGEYTALETTFPQTYIGPVIVRIKGLEIPCRLLMTFGVSHCFVDLEAKSDQYILLEKRNKDVAPFVAAVPAKCSIEVSYHVTNANADNVEWHFSE